MVKKLKVDFNLVEKVLRAFELNEPTFLADEQMQDDFLFGTIHEQISYFSQQFDTWNFFKTNSMKKNSQASGKTVGGKYKNILK